LVWALKATATTAKWNINCPSKWPRETAERKRRENTLHSGRDGFSESIMALSTPIETRSFIQKSFSELIILVKRIVKVLKAILTDASSVAIWPIRFETVFL